MIDFKVCRKEMEWGGRKLVLETGKIARQAEGAVIVTYGETEVIATVCAAKEALVVTTPHLSAVKDADRTARLLYTYDVKSVGLVVNRVRYDLTDRGEAVAPEKIAELMRLKLVGALPESDVIGINAVCGEKGESAKAYACLADFIEGKSDKIYSPDTGRGLFSLFKRRWQ